MTFSNLNSDIICNCLEGSIIDNSTEFALKTNKNFLRENDFKTYWEKERRSDDCKEICSLKGQSVTIIKNEEDLNSTLSVYKQLFPFSPSYRPFCSLIKFNENSGKVKHTPIEINPLHYDFYKSDNFSINDVSLIKSIPLSDV
jgi:hypothetical protein